ncbi:hypothetical protein BJ742DRAFT_806669 [Cladochytrium replicatum]|nr:hypothetical protein BJ742DRAFT_806669 [Cladochytrium replicatum]
MSTSRVLRYAWIRPSSSLCQSQYSAVLLELRYPTMGNWRSSVPSHSFATVSTIRHRDVSDYEALNRNPQAALNLNLFRSACFDGKRAVALDAYNALKSMRMLHVLQREDYFDLVRLVYSQVLSKRKSAKRHTAARAINFLGKQWVVILERIYRDMFEIPNEGKAMRGYVPEDICIAFIEMFDEKDSLHMVREIWDYAVAMDVKTWNAAEVISGSRSGASATRKLPPPFKIQLPFYHSILKVASREDLSLANSVFTHLHQNPVVQPDHEAWKLYISAYCNAKDPAGAMKTFEEMVADSKRSPKKGKANKEEAESLDESLSPTKPTLALYNHLLSAFGKAGDIEGLQKVLKQMTLPVSKGGHGLFPNIFTYNILLDAEALSGNVDGAMAILATMKKDAKRMPHVASTLVTYNTLLNMFAKRGEPNNCEKIFAAMVSAGALPEGASFAPDNVSYHSLMDGYRNANDLAGVRSTFERLCNSGIPPDDTTYGILISSFGFRGDLEAAKGYFEEMLKKGIPPRRAVFGQLMTSHGIHGDLAGADRWYNEMTTMYDMSPDKRIISDMFGFHAEKEDWEKMTFYFEEGHKYTVYSDQASKQDSDVNGGRRLILRLANRLLEVFIKSNPDPSRAIQEVYLPYFRAIGANDGHLRVNPSLKTLVLLGCPPSYDDAMRGPWAILLQDNGRLVNQLSQLNLAQNENVSA